MKLSPLCRALDGLSVALSLLAVRLQSGLLIMSSFCVGDSVSAKYMATTAGAKAPGSWFPGKIAKLHGDGTCDIQYEDGDRENAVLARYIKTVTGKTPATGIDASSRTKRRVPEPSVVLGSTRAGKRRMVTEPAPPPIDVDGPATDIDDDDASVVEVPQPQNAPTIKVTTAVVNMEQDAEQDVVNVEQDAEQDVELGMDDDDDIAIVDAPPRATRADEAVQATEGDDHEEVQCTGRSGENALVDFPYSCCGSYPGQQPPLSSPLHSPHQPRARAAWWEVTRASTA